VKITAPIAAPAQDSVPPTMIIVRAVTTRWKPMVSGDTVVRSRLFMPPAQAPSAPLTTNTRRRTRLTSMPRDTASCGSSRTASIRRPMTPRSLAASSRTTSTVTRTTWVVVSVLIAPNRPVAPPVSSPPLVAATPRNSANAMVAMPR
jgi:hypothetical protein